MAINGVERNTNALASAASLKFFTIPVKKFSNLNYFLIFFSFNFNFQGEGGGETTPGGQKFSSPPPLLPAPLPFLLSHGLFKTTHRFNTFWFRIGQFSMQFCSKIMVHFSSHELNFIILQGCSDWLFKQLGLSYRHDERVYASQASMASIRISLPIQFITYI